MRSTRLVMGMPITVDLGDDAPVALMEEIFDDFVGVDNRFSLYKPTSEINRFNAGQLSKADLSPEMQTVFALGRHTTRETHGYFDMRRPDGLIDPSGIVKGWAVRNAACTIRGSGVVDFYVDAGGDIQTGGKNDEGQDWTVGIRNPFNETEIIKALTLGNRGIATSGSYVRGRHIYNPLRPGEEVGDIVSMTVLGPDVLEADRFATAAFAMGSAGIYFIEDRDGLEAYMVDAQGIATQTTGFGAYVIP
jgi:FAD:protein FMN transferase